MTWGMCGIGVPPARQRVTLGGGRWYIVQACLRAGRAHERGGGGARLVRDAQVAVADGVDAAPREHLRDDLPLVCDDRGASVRPSAGGRARQGGT